MKPRGPLWRVGEGWDTHALVAGRKLVLGGVEIAHTHGLLGHSDADALCHAITDALFGAAAMGDIGRHFPDTDPQFSGADSLVLLSTLLSSQPAARTRDIASASNTSESAPENCGSVSGKWRPMSPSAAAPSSASVIAWHSASASE